MKKYLALVSLIFTVAACGAAPESASTHRTKNAALDVSSLTCAQGGVCKVGDIGPGGGPVFYVAPAPFTSAGSDCNTSCKYLERSAMTVSKSLPYAYGMGCYGGVTNTYACDKFAFVPLKQKIDFAINSTPIGMGMSNTDISWKAMVAGGTPPGKSIFDAVATFEANGKTDWFIPSFDEAMELCKYYSMQPSSDATCLVKTPVREGFFFPAFITSSPDRYGANFFRNVAPGQTYVMTKNTLVRTYGVRAF